MGRRAKLRYLLTGSYTRQGYYSFVPELLDGMQKLWIVTGPVGSGKSYFIRTLGEDLANRGFEVEFWLSAVESGSVEGVHLPQVKAAIVNGSLLQPGDNSYPDINGEVVELSRGLKEEENRNWEQETRSIVEDLQEHNRQARYLIHEAVELENLRNMSFAQNLDPDRLEVLVDDIEHALFKPEPGERHFFGLALTVDGMVNYLQEATRDCRSRYILQGPADCGQEQVMQKMADKAAALGYHREYFYRALDPQRPCMLLIRELQAAVIDAGLLPLANQPGDVIIDMRRNLTKTSDSWDNGEGYLYGGVDVLLIQAQMELEEIYRLHRTLKRVRSGAIDFEWVDNKRQEIVRKIIRG
ncbi:MAG TPA: hypothetical protein VN426_00820 [Syntrophomonadaceae bacterium]|nr:hypothetical protein [Syntrophomonadaceae bacterium]